MASNIDIQKKCEWCGVIFTAHKTSTAYCSHRCANLAYKERVRKKRVQEFQLKFDEEAKPHSEKEFLTPTEVSSFLGVGRTSIYRFNNLYCVFSLWNAKDLAMRSKGNYNDWRNVMRYQLMIVDDLGTEPREVMEFGNVYTPLIDLITTRYEEQLFTIFTTNLTPAQLEEKYGKRIVDRLNEMVEKVVFENESYRR